MSEQVVNLILKRIVETLQANMNTGLTEDDLLYVDLMKRGLLQENKVQKNVTLAVSGGDHDDPSYKDGIVTLDAFEDLAFNVPAREVGGGEMWWRRGVVRVEAFFIKQKLTEDEAHDAAYELLGKLLYVLDQVDMSGLSDDFDETAIKLFPYANTFFESGGKPNQFIFRGKVFWACLTERY